MRQYLIIAFLLFYSSTCFAFFPMKNGYFQGNQGNGWFWYRVKSKKQKNKSKHLDLPAIKKMNVKQLKSLLKKELNIAVSYPSVLNVKRWLEVKNIVMARSARFAAVSKYAITKYPYLGVPAQGVGMGSSSFNSEISFDIKHMNRNKLFKKIQKKVGLVLFYNPSSAKSIQESRMLFLVCHEFGFYFQNEDMSNHPNAVRRYDIRYSPTIVMFYKHKSGKLQHFILLIGLRTQGAIKNQIAYDYYALIKKHVSLSKYNY